MHQMPLLQFGVNLLSLSACFLNASKLKTQGKLEDAINQYKAALHANPEYMVCRTANQCYSSLQHAPTLIRHASFTHGRLLPWRCLSDRRRPS